MAFNDNSPTFHINEEPTWIYMGNWWKTQPNVAGSNSIYIYLLPEEELDLQEAYDLARALFLRKETQTRAQNLFEDVYRRLYNAEQAYNAKLLEYARRSSARSDTAVVPAIRRNVHYTNLLERMPPGWE